MADVDKKLKVDKDFRLGFEHQLRGDIHRAIYYYKKSIEVSPSPEALTFLAWAYSFFGWYDQAIEECVKAIEFDPEFGNPWNDIGAYLIEKGNYDEAIFYLKRATRSKNYNTYCYPYYNLSRIWIKKGMHNKAIASIYKALEANPNFTPAINTLNHLIRRVN